MPKGLSKSTGQYEIVTIEESPRTLIVKMICSIRVQEHAIGVILLFVS